MTKRLQVVAQVTGTNLGDLSRVAARYPFQLTGFIAGRLRDGTYSQEALIQFLPDLRELSLEPGYDFDPCDETSHKLSRCLIKRYPNRAALILTQRCLAYCRFCFRRDFVGFDNQAVFDTDVNKALDLLSRDTEVRDVLVTGGDPLALPDRNLLPLLRRLASISTVNTIRLHTRAVSLSPTRISPSLLGLLSESRKFWLYSHMNHPDDVLHPEVSDAIQSVERTGTPHSNQCVLLRGVNDDPRILRELMLLLYKQRVRPYHLYAFDRVRGAAHFDIEAGRILHLFRSLADLPGPAQPVFVVVDSTNTKRRFAPSRDPAVADALETVLRTRRGPQCPS